MSARRIVFITREPMIHQMGGSTTCALNLLELLTRCGDVTAISMTAYSRSPRLWFRQKVDLPPGVTYLAPGMLKLGNLYLNVFSPRAWARFISRLAMRVPAVEWLSKLVQKACGDALFCGAWDLTPPTDDERQAVLWMLRKLDPETVVVNYAFWSPLFDEPGFGPRRKVVLMHDLLSARVARFLASGLPLDCPMIDQATEMAWLGRADTLLAAQAREAEVVQPYVTARVIVQPMVFTARASIGKVEPNRVLFVGSNIVPNQTGLAWFLESVWPAVLAQVPAARLAVVGSVCATMEAGQPGVEWMGLVPSIEEEYARAAVCVIPLLVGSGIKIKLLEALSYGRATVSTTIGIQGLEAWAPGAVEVTDDPVQFAAAVLRLLRDPGERRRLEQAGLELATRHFGTATALPAEFMEAMFASAPTP